MHNYHLELLLATLAVAAPAPAQHPVPIDVSLSYSAEYAKPVGLVGNFWLQGGSAEVGANVWHGFGAAANVTVAHTSSFGPNAIPLMLTTLTAGPRFRYGSAFQEREISVYGEALAGWGHGGGSIFPAPSGVTTKASSLATQLGGGVDVEISPRVGARVIQVSWLRTQLPNSTKNVQNTLSIGAGLVLKF